MGRGNMAEFFGKQLKFAVDTLKRRADGTGDNEALFGEQIKFVKRQIGELNHERQADKAHTSRDN